MVVTVYGKILRLLRRDREVREVKAPDGARWWVVKYRDVNGEWEIMWLPSEVEARKALRAMLAYVAELTGESVKAGE